MYVCMHEYVCVCVYILSARSMNSCPLPVGHDFEQLVGRLFSVMMEGYVILQQTCQEGGEWANSGMG